MDIRDRIVEFTRLPARSLAPHPKNWRAHPQSQQDALRGILAEVGYVDALMVRRLPDGRHQILDGHLRAETTPDQEVPCLVVELDDQEAEKVLATFDPLAGMAETSKEQLAQLLESVQPENEALRKMLEELAIEAGIKQGAQMPPLADEDIPAPPDKAETEPGDIWTLGDHRLMCGDSANPEHVDRLLAGETIQLVNMDPPYNVKVEPRSNNAIAAGLTSFSRREDLQCERSTSERGKRDRERMAKQMHHQGMDLARHPGKSKATNKKLRAKDRPLANDFVSDEAFDEMLLAWFGNASRVLDAGRSFYIWGGYANCANYPPALRQCGLYFSQAIIWDKEHPVLTRKDFMGAHEWCFYGWKEGAGHRFFGPNNATDLWHVKKINPNKMVHLTEKPVELAVRALLYSSLVRENVLDLFGGSGSTMIAAEQVNRRAFLMELDPLYCDVIVQRWKNLTGRQASKTPGREPAVAAPEVANA